jgi:hypothetical protein
MSQDAALYFLIGALIILVAIWKTPDRVIDEMEDLLPKVILFILIWPLFLGIMGFVSLGDE